MQISIHTTTLLYTYNLNIGADIQILILGDTGAHSSSRKLDTNAFNV